MAATEMVVEEETAAEEAPWSGATRWWRVRGDLKDL